MNRFQLVQVAVIAVALCLGYTGVSYFCWTINQLIMSMSDSNSGMIHYALINGISALLYLVSFFLIITKTSPLAEWVLTKTDLDPDVQLNISVTSFLLGVIVFWSLKILVESGADIITYLVNSFYSTTSIKIDRLEGSNAVTAVVKLIAGIILLRYAKPLSQYFENQTDEHDPHQIIGDVATEEDV